MLSVIQSQQSTTALALVRLQSLNFQGERCVEKQDQISRLARQILDEYLSICHEQLNTLSLWERIVYNCAKVHWILSLVSESICKVVSFVGLKSNLEQVYLAESKLNIILNASKQSTLRQNYGSCVTLSNQLRADRNFILNLMKVQGSLLEQASEQLQADKEVVLAAVKQNGLALKFANPRLRADKDVILEAVKQNGQALLWVDRAFKSDREVVLAAVMQSHEALMHANFNYRATREVDFEVFGSRLAVHTVYIDIPGTE